MKRGCLGPAVCALIALASCSAPSPGGSDVSPVLANTARAIPAADAKGPAELLYVADTAGADIRAYNVATGALYYDIAGTNTKLTTALHAVAVNPVNGNIFGGIGQLGQSTVIFGFGSGVTGNAVPFRTITDTGTIVHSLAFDSSGDLWTCGDSYINVYPYSVTNPPAAPSKQISPIYELLCSGIVIGPAGEVYTSQRGLSTGQGAIVTYTAGSISQFQAVSGSATELSDPESIALYIPPGGGKATYMTVADDSADKVLSYPVSANGDPAPYSWIPANGTTKLQAPASVAIDQAGTVFVYDSKAKCIYEYPSTVVTGAGAHNVAPSSSICDLPGADQMALWYSTY